ncbi:MAG: hypothetical protein CMK00_01895 [Planctomycetes bacterium]|nr:hypothetical protein [Planctomycetota bacterium]HJO27041.1 AI-2E family transporter [Planctomycetota bacterium]
MLQRLSPAVRNAVLVLIGICVVAFAWQVRAVLNPLILGYLCAYIVHPLVLRLEKRGWRRRTAVNLIFIAGGLLLTLAAGAVVLQGRTLVTDLSTREDLAERIESRVEAFTERYGEALRWVLPPDSAGPDGEQASPGAGSELAAAGDAAKSPGGLADMLNAGWQALSQEQQSEAGQAAGQAALAGAGGAWSILRRLFGSLLALGVLLILLPVYTYFLLFELEHIHRFVRTYLPAEERSRLSHVAAQIGEVLANFFRGRMTVCLLKGALISLGLWAAGIDYAFLLGMGGGFLSLVPFVGPLLGFVAAFLLGLVEYEFLSALLRAGIVFGLAEVIEGYVLVPKVLGDSLGLHPVVVLVSVMVGGAALGMFGLLLALPITAAVVIIARELVLPALKDWADSRGTA